MSTTQLTKDNIREVITNPKKYTGFHFTIDGEAIHDAREFLTIQAGYLLAVWRHLPFKITITSPYKAHESIQQYFPQIPYETFDGKNGTMKVGGM
jgi:hypothetical protein